MKFGIFIFLAIAQAIIGAGHYFIYRTLVRFGGISSATTLSWLRPAFVVLSLSFLAMSLAAAKFYGPVIRVLYSSAAVWFGTAYWLIVAALLSWLIYYLVKLVWPGFNVAPLALVLLLVAVLVSAYGVWNSYQTRVRHITIKLDQLPEQWKGRKAVIMADTHLGNVRNRNFGEHIATLVNEHKPDIVLFAGDLYDGTIDDYATLVAPLLKIESRFGFYFAAGNHEEFRDSEALLAPLRAQGVHVLANELVDVDGLQVAGINYSDATTKEKEAAVLEGLDLKRSKASILIKHVPDHLESAQAAGFDLQVSGHTHTGQMWPFNLLTKRIFGKFFYGLNRLDTLQVYTTSGVGTWGPPQRVATNAEIVVATFE